MLHSPVHVKRQTVRGFIIIKELNIYIIIRALSSSKSSIKLVYSVSSQYATVWRARPAETNPAPLQMQRL